ncbi:hypothetical protein HK104_010277 [Borealophlyctis nickersoniae]|nr:hypothetical protein HK104_010277 [Borealophlyctis nickersoniae]
MSADLAKVAIVFGANGISGIAALDHLTWLTPLQWKRIIAVSRRHPQMNIADERVKFVSIDILASSVEELADKLREVGGDEATHAFHYTYVEKKDEMEAVKVNKELLDKALKATAAVSEKMEVFLLQTGYKYYGTHKGPGYMPPLPWKEDAPRLSAPNFYYDQEDLLVEFTKSKGWAHLITRPNVIIGVSKGNFMNFAVSIALYAVVQKESGQPLVFPGNQVMYENIIDHSSAANNARFQVWAASNHTKALHTTWNHAYNIHDGDVVRFKDLWPKIAKYFDMDLPAEAEAFSIPPPKPGEIKCQRPLTEYMKDKDKLWEQVAKTYGLDSSAFQCATWAFADFIVGRTWSDQGDMSKARHAGWDVTVDSFQAYVDVFDRMKLLNLIPKYPQPEE